jgi:hypothetical protein
MGAWGHGVVRAVRHWRIGALGHWRIGTARHCGIVALCHCVIVPLWHCGLVALWHWAYLEGDRPAVGVAAWPVKGADAAACTKEVPGDAAAKAVLCQRCGARLTHDVQLVVRHHKVDVTPHAAVAAVAVPHDQVRGRLHLEAHVAAVAAANVQGALLHLGRQIAGGGGGSSGHRRPHIPLPALLHAARRGDFAARPRRRAVPGRILSARLAGRGPVRSCGHGGGSRGGSRRRRRRRRCAAGERRQRRRGQASQRGCGFGRG